MKWLRSTVFYVPQTIRFSLSKRSDILQRDTLSPEIISCVECGKKIKWENLTRSQKSTFKKTGRAYCSPECRSARQSRISSETMAKTNRKYASERMRNKNPMQNPETREKMVATLHEIGHKPSAQGGNGRGLTDPQKILLKALDGLDAWPEFVVKTNQPKYNPYHLPSHYKIDIAIPRCRLAIEVDGGSHCSMAAKEKDAKKTAFLQSKGCSVLRFTNAQILQDEKNCAQAVMSTISKLMETTTISQTVI